MTLTYEKVREFARRDGKVVAFALSAEAKILANGEIDSVHLIEDATYFSFDGKSYPRQEFENLIDSTA